MADAPSPHTLVHGQRLPNGDTELACHCKASFSGPPADAVEAYRRHMSEPFKPATSEEAG